jgi:hypothetical protein
VPSGRAGGSGARKAEPRWRADGTIRRSQQRGDSAGPMTRGRVDPPSLKRRKRKPADCQHHLDGPRGYREMLRQALEALDENRGSIQ